VWFAAVVRCERGNGGDVFMKGKIAADRLEIILRMKRRLGEESQYMN